MDDAKIRNQLAAAGQEHVLRFLDSVDPAGRARLFGQVAAMDLSAISDLADKYVRRKPHIALPTRIEPIQPLPHSPDTARAELYKSAAARGNQLLAQGKIAAFLVAGGQGTRLGYDGPKGEFPVTPIKKKSLFQVFAEQILFHGRRVGKEIPWYLMTSDANDAATRAFFAKHNYFGLSQSQVFFFQQGMMPAFALDGKLLLSEKDSLALSPDGHGGSLRALFKSGALADMRRRGVEHLCYIQVDNPIVHCIDPLFIGLHDATASEMSSKTIPKAEPMERVGNFVVGDGVTQVIEYSDLPDSLAKQTLPDGSPRFNSASIGIHILSVAFVERLNASGRLSLPWHRAEKKVPSIDERGQQTRPEKPNAVKLEQFVFDAIPLAKNAMVYATDRAEEFSPVKNAEGVDSPAQCRRDQLRRTARWLRQAGVEIPTLNGEPNATIEISPLFAETAQALAVKHLALHKINPGQEVYLD